MSEDEPRRGEAPDSSGSVTEIVVEALELEGEARRRYLDTACRDDAALRAEVDSLLDEEAKAPLDDFLSMSAPEQIRLQRATEAADTSEPMVERVGRFRILRLLGEGGMGAVYLAAQDEPVERQVALKVIRLTHREQLRARFAAECRALARLNHPNVVSMFEVGATDDGLPWVATEWIDGRQITDWCDEARAGVEERLRLFLGVCAGVSHAHEKGILHLDLKPSNVLVARVSGEEVVKVIDFGIAHALEDPDRMEDDATAGLILGSPAYISPEAVASAGRQHLDTRTDVYSLGLVLYELLAGALPFETVSRPFWSRSVRPEDPPLPPPSQRLRELDASRAAEIAKCRRTKPRRLSRRLAGDLDAIVAKAIERDPKDRYATPAELAGDLRRHLERRIVEARAPTPTYRLRTFVRRHLGAVHAVALLVLALAGGLAMRTVEAERTKQALAESEQVRQFMEGLFEGADPDRRIGEALTVRELLDQGAERLREDLPEQPLTRARFFQSIGAIYTKLGELERASDVIGEALEIRRRLLPAGHPDIVESESEIGVIYRRLGRYDEAEPLLRSVLEARRGDPEIDDELLARALSNLGNLYWSQARFEEAEAVHREAWTLRQRNTELLGTAQARSDEAFSANNLGVMLRSRRKYAEARPILLRAVELFRQEDLAPLGSALNNLGLVDRFLPTWAEAEAHFREAIAVHEATVGPAHVRPLNSQRNLIVELGRRHRFDEAVERGQQIVAVAETMDDALNLASVLRSFGYVQFLAGRYDDAVVTFGRSLDLVVSTHGPEHPDTLYPRSLLAMASGHAGEVDAALAELREIAAIQEERLGADHDSRLRTAFYAGRTALAAGRTAAAEAWLRTYLDGHQRKLGDNHPTVAEGCHWLGLAIAAEGRDDEALAFFERALEIRRSIFGDRHPDVAATAHELGLIAARRGDLARAVELLELAVAARRAAFPADDADLRASVDALAQLGDKRPEIDP